MHKDQHRANKKRKLCLNRFRKAILKAKRDPKNEKLQQLRKEAEQKWKEQVKIYRQVRKRCEYRRQVEQMESIKKDHSKSWDFIHACTEVKQPSVSSSMQLKCKKTGKILAKNEMADYKADYTFDRAHLVSDEDIEKHAGYIPLPNIPGPRDTEKEVYVNQIPVKELFNLPEKFKSLACGPDTISMYHIKQFGDTLTDALQFALDKPLDKFHNIEKNLSRFIKKQGVKSSTIDAKDVRPICEANILSKYGPIKAFINQLKADILPKLNKNQYSLPGRGTPAAIFDLFDSINCHASLRLPLTLSATTPLSAILALIQGQK